LTAVEGGIGNAVELLAGFERGLMDWLRDAKPGPECGNGKRRQGKTGKTEAHPLTRSAEKPLVRLIVRAARCQARRALDKGRP
jgi:hypothetical protein